MLAHLVAMLAYVDLSCGKCGPSLELCWPSLGLCWPILKAMWADLEVMKPTTSDIHGTARPLQQRVAYDRKEGRENVQKDWVRISVQRKICISECLNSLCLK